MEKLPEKSEASTYGGIWFVWNDGSNIIRVWGSAISGKEKIYLNDKLVSEKKNLKINSEHKFEDTSKNVYEVKINVASLFSGKLECQFKKNGEVRKKYVCKFIFGRIFKLKNIGFFFLGFVIIFILDIYLKLTMPVIFISGIILFGIIYRISDKKRYSIEEIDV